MSDLLKAATGGLVDSDIFKAKTSLRDVRTKQAKTGADYLASLLTGGTPTIPTEEIAGMSDAEKLAQQLAMQYGSSEGEGLDTLRSIAAGSDNILDDPTISALMEAIGKRGDLTANRLSRSLMLRGGTGGAGRDMLGRSVTDTQNEMLSTLAPYATAAKNRQLSAAQLLNQLGENSTLNRLNALSATGSLPRTLQQMQNTANYNQALQQILFPYTYGASVAGTLSGSQPMAVEQSPSLFSQIAPLIQQGAMMIAGAGSGA